MKTRDAVIQYQKTLDDSGTLIEDLNLVDPVSALYLEFQNTNGSTSNKGNFLSDVITKIEITDGSEVLYSLSLAQLEALYFYKTLKTPLLFPSEWGGGAQRHGVYLLFGRYLWDPTFNMDFRRYTNPQLKITSNIAAVRAASAATAMVSGSLLATIVAKIAEGESSAPSFLAAREIEAFTSAPSGEKRIDLPVDKTLRMAMLRAYVSESDIDEVITDLKLTADTDKLVMFNRKMRQLDSEAFMEFGSAQFKHDIFCSHQDTVRLLCNKEPDVTPYYDTTATPSVVGVDWAWSSAMKLNIYDAATPSADTTDRNYTMIERGHALHATLPILFGLPDVPSTWFDPRPYKKLELVATQAVAAACSVVVEQVR